MNLNEVKAGAVLTLGGLTAWLGGIAPAVWFLLALMITDYATGMTAAPFRGEARSSDKGFRGIAKKVCMLVLVGLGLGLDWLLLYAAGSLALVPPFKFAVAALVTVWLICNETVSILENIGDIGVEPPPFLLPLVRWVKEQAEARVAPPDEEEK